MLRFPVEWEFKYSDLCGSRSNMNLDDEWTLSCQWKFLDGACSGFHKLEFIEICRKTNREATSIFGTFTLQSIEPEESTQTFSQLVESGSAFTKLIDLQMNVTVKCGYRSRYSLHGFVNIISVSGKCTSDFETRGCKLCKLSDDFGRLLDPETSCNADINLKCGSASIPAHKLILSARSPVFAAMFRNQMKEVRKNEVDITDIEASVLQAMVTYIYSGKTSDLTVSSASELLFAAEKYQLPELKSVCCEFLKGNVSPQNVIRFLNLGDVLAEDLKSFSVDYICQKYTTFAEFEKLEEWETMMKENPALAVQVLASLLKSKDAKKKGILF